MNRPFPLQSRLALLAVLFGALGVRLSGGGWQAVTCAFVAGLFALVLAANRAVPPTPMATAQLPPADILATPELDALLDGMAEPVLICDRGKVVRANRPALRLLGNHIVGEDVRIAIRHPAAAERLANPNASPAPTSINLVGIGTRDQRWEMRISPLSADRRIVQLINRTGRYAAEKMRVDFVANASHELRTPLAAILGFIETLADPKAGGDRETRARFLQIMDGEARRMQRLVDDLMSLSRIEAEKYRLPSESVNLADLVREAVGIFNTSYGVRGADVVADLDGPIPPVQGDRAQLSQLVHNLVSNSIKYARPGTPIAVGLTPGPGNMVKLTVADEGEGIPPDHLPRLTERFYRVDSGRSRAMGGTGLGLAIVKHVVERHRGRLDINSVLGRGTTISILLPRAEPVDGPHGPASSALS